MITSKRSFFGYQNWEKGANGSYYHVSIIKLGDLTTVKNSEHKTMLVLTPLEEDWVC